MEFLGVLAGSHLADTSMSRMTKTNGYPKKRVWVHPHKTLTDTSTAIRALYFLALQIRDSLTKVQKFTGIESPSLLPSWLRPPGWVCHSEPEWHWATKPQLQVEACPASQSHESSCTRSILGLLPLSTSVHCSVVTRMVHSASQLVTWALITEYELCWLKALDEHIS